ncbi:MAG: 50S ribosomal protein L11 methyltransferase [Pseudomonadota bacterium]
MYKISATGPKAPIEKAWHALAWTDPSPAEAVDYKEETRRAWRLDAYAADQDAADACLAIIASAAPDLATRAAPLEARDWVALSLEGLPAIRAGRFIVAGAHSLPGTSNGLIPIKVEAGPAFGTGHHGTTLGCLTALDRIGRRSRPGKVLDIGTGTGLLAIAALKLGARLAVASDIDADSVRVAAENGRFNEVSSRLKCIQAAGTASRYVRRFAPYDLVFANILSRPLIRLAPDIAAITAPGGSIVLSGLLNHQAPLVSAAYRGRRLVPTARIRRDGWSTLVFRKQGKRKGGLSSRP